MWWGLQVIYASTVFCGGCLQKAYEEYLFIALAKHIIFIALANPWLACLAVRPSPCLPVFRAVLVLKKSTVACPYLAGIAVPPPSEHVWC